MGKVEYCRADVAERLLTLLFIKNADVIRFLSFGEELQSQQSLRNDQYPSTVLVTQEIIEDRKCDESFYDQQQKYSQDVSKAARDDVADQITTVDEIPELTFQQLELR
jgi:D-alanine-D-alanine ligase-like ATP-grasp enzyme